MESGVHRRIAMFQVQVDVQREGEGLWFVNATS